MEPNIKPLDRAGLSEVLARVAFRLIELDYKRDKLRYIDPVDGMLQLSADLSDTGLAMLSTWVAAYAAQKRRRAVLFLSTIRTAFIERAAVPGVSWRVVAFPEYKANRRYR